MAELKTITPVSPLPKGWREAIDAIEAADLTPVLCPACERPGAVANSDEHGTLIAHPGRRWPCRVAGTGGAR